MNETELMRHFENAEKGSKEEKRYISLLQQCKLEYNFDADKAEEVLRNYLIEKYENKDPKFDTAELNTLQHDFPEWLEKQGHSNVEIDSDPWRGHEADFIKLLSDYRYTDDPKKLEHLKKFSSAINDDELRFVYELIQNADDCKYDPESTPEVTISRNKENDKEVLQFSYSEVGMTSKDIIAITTVGDSNKRNRKKGKMIGEKGIGFRTIFSACESVEIHSRNYHFKLNGNVNEGSGFIPELIDGEEEPGTRTLLTMSHQTQNREWITEICSKWGIDFEKKEVNQEHAFSNCPILFTNQIKKITLKENEKFLVSIELGKDAQSGDVIKYSFAEDGTNVTEIPLYRVERPVRFDYKVYNERYKNQYSESEYEAELKNGNPNLIYKIAVVAPKDCSKITKGNLYSYFPTSTQIKAPFSLQLPFKLNLDRSCMWFYGDQDTDIDVNSVNKEKDDTLDWNKLLLKEMFGSKSDNEIGESLMQEFYKVIADNEGYKYIPNFTDKDIFELAKASYTNGKERYDKNIEKLNEILNKLCDLFERFKEMKYWRDEKAESQWYDCDHVLMFEKFVCDREPDFVDNFTIEYEDRIARTRDLMKLRYNSEIYDKIKVFQPKYVMPDLKNTACDGSDWCDWLNKNIERFKLQDVVLDYILDEKEGAEPKLFLKLCNCNIKYLKIFKASRGKNDEFEYKSLTEGRWWYLDTLSDRKLNCDKTNQINILAYDKEKLAKIKANNKIEKLGILICKKSFENLAEEIFDEILEIIRKKQKDNEVELLDEEMFKEAVNFRRRNDPDYEEKDDENDKWVRYYIENILPNEKKETKKNSIDIYQTFIKILQEKIGRLECGEYD